MKVYGIIGHPVKHTLSPAMHNAAFRASGMDAVYVPFEVRPGDLAVAFKSLPALGICGFNVTIPHKTSCMKFLDEIENSARIIGAVNTVKIENKKLSGYNTDGPGFLHSLKKDLKVMPKDKNIFVIGAGGAARAVVWALAKNHARLTVVVDKMQEKASELANTFSAIGNVKHIKYNDDWAPYLSASDILVNATPVGMKEKNVSPVDTRMLHKGLSVFDLVYNKRTGLIKAAKAKGLNACGGFGMLLYQGAMAFEIWTGKNPPVGIMRSALISQLSLRGPRNVRWWS